MTLIIQGDLGAVLQRFHQSGRIDRQLDIYHRILSLPSRRHSRLEPVALLGKCFQSDGIRHCRHLLGLLRDGLLCDIVFLSIFLPSKVCFRSSKPTEDSQNHLHDFLAMLEPSKTYAARTTTFKLHFLKDLARSLTISQNSAEKPAKNVTRPSTPPQIHSQRSSTRFSTDKRSIKRFKSDSQGLRMDDIAME